MREFSSILYLFIYKLSSTANGQLQSQQKYKQQQYDNTGHNNNNNKYISLETTF
jgi:hypothetical protein